MARERESGAPRSQATVQRGAVDGAGRIADGPDAAASDGRSWWVALAVVFALAWGLRVAALAAYERAHPLAFEPVIDEDSYDRWALSIADGDWLGDEVFFQEPLYPYALSVVYVLGDRGPERLTRARHAQALMGALTAVLVALLGRRLFGVGPGLVAGLAFASYRPAIFTSLLILKPSLVLPLVAAIALLLVDAARSGWSARRALLFGLAAGAGALLRGNFLLLLPVFAALPLAASLAASIGAGRRAALAPALRASALVALGAAAALVPVATRNWVVGRQFALTTSGAGTNLYGGNNAHNLYGVATEFDWVRGVPDHEPDDWRREAEKRLGKPLAATEVSGYWLAQTLDSLRAAPAMHARILLAKLRLALSSYEVPDNRHLEWDTRWIAPLRFPWRALQGGFGVWGWFGLAGLLWFALRAARGREPRPAAAVWVACFAAAYVGTIVLTVMSGRIRLALVPLLLPFAGWFAVRVWSLARGAWGAAAVSGRWRGLGAAALALAATAFVHDPVIDAETRVRKLATRDMNLAQALLESDPGAAQALALGMAERYPRSLRAWTLVHEADYRRALRVLDDGSASEAERGRARESVLATLAALEAAEPAGGSAQNRFRLDYLRGAVRQYVGSMRNEPGDWSRALAHYERALAFDDEDPDLLRRYALCLANATTELPPEERRAALERAAAIVRALATQAAERGTPDPGLAALGAQFEAALAALSDATDR